MKDRLHILAKVALAGALLAMTSACGQDPKLEGPQHETVENYVEGAELLCIVESEDEAKEIADMYGIELVDYKVGVATFHTEEDPRAVVERGIENGYPGISINGIGQTN